MKFNLLAAPPPLVSVIILVLFLAISLMVVFSLWNIFVKAGRSGVLAFIPLYNIVVLLEITGAPLWLLVLFFVPVVNVAMLFVLGYWLSKAFGYDLEFAVGLFFLPFVFLPILAFGKSQYIPPHL